MYNGYLLKIDGTTLPNWYLVPSTYSVNDAPIVVSEYYDANYNKHIEYAPQNEVVVSFNYRQLYESEFITLAAFFDSEMTVEYYEPTTGTYKTGVFAIKENINPVLDRLAGGKIIYKEGKIDLIRKKVE